MFSIISFSINISATSIIFSSALFLLPHNMACSRIEALHRYRNKNPFPLTVTFSCLTTPHDTLFTFRLKSNRLLPFPSLLFSEKEGDMKPCNTYFAGKTIDVHFYREFRACVLNGRIIVFNQLFA